MDGLFRRLRERKLVQWALAYAAAGFALVQGLDLVAQRFGWPEAVARGALVVLAVGFFVTLVLAWYHGERGAQRASGTELLIIALLLAIGGGLLAIFAPHGPDASPTASGPPAKPAAVTDRKSIAVLAFSDLSPGKDHEYLSDGIAEEVLNALTRVPGLKVAGRTSAFHYKGRNEDLREIGRSLDVAHVLEGSVRTQDDKVRITAQLIRTADGFHLWSDNYDGQLTDVFDLEDQIARKIVRELDVLLQGEDTARMVQVATRNPEAYALYLRALAVFNRREGPRYADAIAWLDQAVQLDAGFARAYALRASLRAVALSRGGSDSDLVEADARRALGLDPRLAQAHLALSRMHLEREAVAAARDEAEQAIALDPGDADANLAFAQALLHDGYVKAGRERLERTLAIDPLLPNALFWRGYQRLSAGDYPGAERDFKRADEVGLDLGGKIGLLELARAKGDYATAEKLLPALFERQRPCGGASWRDAPLAIHLGQPGTAAERMAALALIDRCLASKPDPVPLWAYLNLSRLEPERALAAVQDARVQNFSGLLMELWVPRSRAERASPGFLAYARKVGLVDVWEKYGPPDDCKRTAPGEYTCS